LAINEEDDFSFFLRNNTQEIFGFSLNVFLNHHKRIPINNKENISKTMLDANKNSKYKKKEEEGK